MQFLAQPIPRKCSLGNESITWDTEVPQRQSPAREYPSQVESVEQTEESLDP